VIKHDEDEDASPIYTLFQQSLELGSFFYMGFYFPE